jgi:tRNA pseudouridine38-40 synthase
MPRFKLTIEYDGSGFAGWQRQENGPSIQQAIEEAVVALTSEASIVHGAGRTDAGVHASGQVAHVELTRPWESWRLREALNAHLTGHRIAVLKCERASDAFDARRDATRRHYLYLIVNRRAPLTLEFHRAWPIKRALNAAAMHEAAQVLIGKHDFSTFRDSQCQANSPLRTLDAFEITREGDRVEAQVSARSFLHRQVRSMVGSLVEVGLGKWSASDFRAALEAADRARCGPVAPACGLYLERVDYEM